MLSNTVMQGVITPTAAYLLNATNSFNPDTHQTTRGSVTFSWYKIQCASPEVIIDVLKTASTMTSSSSNHGNHSTKGIGGDSNSLVLRELGKGRGMIIPGLWEVEIANSGDIEAVVNHLQKIIPEVADHSVGDAHTVMQLTINRTGQSNNPPVSSYTATTVTDVPGLGRITFLLLSHLHPSNGGLSSAPVAAVCYPWVELMRMVLNVLQVHGSTPVFHKSRLLLLMKDVLLRRQNAAAILMLLPSMDQRKTNNDWLRLFGQLNAMKTLNSSLITDLTCLSESTMKSNNSNHPNSHTALQTPSSRSATPTVSRSIATPFNRTATPTNHRKSMVNSSIATTTATAAASSSLKSNESTSRTSSRLSAANGTTFAPSFSSTSHEQLSTTTTTVKRRATSILKQQMVRSEDNGAGAGPLFAMNTNSSIEDPSTMSDHDSHTNSDSRNIHVSSGSNNTKSINDNTSHQQNSSSSASSIPPVARVVSDNESALQLALEASRSEAEALKLAVKHTTDRYQDLKESHDVLMEQLKEDVSSHAMLSMLVIITPSIHHGF